MECECEKCQRACQRKPGWFKPGEAEKVAEFLGMPFSELYETKLVKDFWEDDSRVYLLSPAWEGSLPGQVAPENPEGQCIFYLDGLCSIHSVKPFECREYDHTKSSMQCLTVHEDIANSWRDKQDTLP